MSHRKSTGCAWLIPGTLELFRSPSLDALHLSRIRQGDVSDRHAVLSRRLPSLFGQTTGAGLPIGGDFQFSQKFYEAVRAIRSASAFVRRAFEPERDVADLPDERASGQARAALAEAAVRGPGT